MNPVTYAKGLDLNISEHSNPLDLDLVIEVAPYFRIKTKDEARRIFLDIAKQVSNWRNVASSVGLNKTDQDRMAPAFRVAEQYK